MVEATKQDYHSLLEQELHRATRCQALLAAHPRPRVWIEDAIQLLPRLGAGGQVVAMQEEGVRGGSDTGVGTGIVTDIVDSRTA